MADTMQMYLDGQWVDAADGARFDTLDPATGEVLATIPAGSAEDADRAVRAARRAFDDGTWGIAVAERDRADLLFKIAAILRRDTAELAELETHDTGKPYEDAVWDIEESAFMFEYYAGWATKISGDIPPIGPDAMSLIVKEPVGVCGLIVPWNYPLLMASQKVAPALAAGCTVVLKPAEQTPLTALGLARAADEAGVPAGVLNVLTGLGPDAGQPLLEHPEVDKISFTGSKAIGQHIMRTCADSLKRVTLELGGKSPEHRLRRRRPGRGHPRQRLGHLRQPGRGLLRREPDLRRAAGLRRGPGRHGRRGQGHQDRLGVRPRRDHGPAGVGEAAGPGAGLHRLGPRRRRPCRLRR